MLFKHTYRYIMKHNKMLFLAILAMLLLTSMVGFALLGMNQTMKEIHHHYKTLQMEQFQFLPLVDQDSNMHEVVRKLEEEYQFKSELQRSKYRTEHDIHYRVMMQHERINQTHYIFGAAAKHDNELVIDVQTANRLQLTVGDSYTFDNEEYIISGIASFPAIIKPNMSETGYVAYSSSHSIIMEVTDTKYEQLAGEEKAYFSAIWLGEHQPLDKSSFGYILMEENNPELNVLNIKTNMNSMIISIAVSVMLSIVLIMLAMIIMKLIQDHSEIYGVFKGMGYGNMRIALSFIPITILLVIPVVVGNYIAAALQKPMFEIMNSDILLPYISGSINPLTMIAVVGIFSLFVFIFSTMMIYFQLNKDPILLMRGQSVEHNGWIKSKLLQLVSRKNELLNLRNKFMFRNLFVLALLLFAGFAIGVQLLLALAMMNFPDQMVRSVEKQHQYKHQIVFNHEMNIDKTKEHQGYLLRNVEYEHEGTIEQLELIALDEDSPDTYMAFFEYRTNKAINNQLVDGVIISKWLANKFNWQVGDSIVSLHKGREIVLHIAGINLNLQGKEMYTAGTYYERQFNESVTAYSGVFSNSAHTIDEANIGQLINSDETIKAVQQTTAQYKLISIALLVIGFLLGGILLSISLYIALKHGEKNILLLKAIGYNDREVNRVSIWGYIYPVLVGLIISIPYVIFLGKILFDTLSKSSTLFISIELNWWNIVIVMISTVVFFYLISISYILKIRNLKNFQHIVS